jgi:hypothetical protein
MFCPQCSQAQVNTELKFCSRCGFPLHGVKELMANGGEPRVKQATGSRRAIAIRRIVQGMIIIICSLMGGGILTTLGREYGFSRLPGTLTILIGFLIGALRTLTAMIPASTADAPATPDRSATTGPIVVDPAHRPATLSEARTRPIDQEFIRPRESPVPVPSVTEHTTELLEHP